MEDIKLTAEQTEERFGIKLTNRDAVQILNAASKLEGRDYFFGYDFKPANPDAPISIGLRKVDGEDVFNLGAILWIATVAGHDESEDSPVMRHVRDILNVRRTLAA